jgi:hypothetical protein
MSGDTLFIKQLRPVTQVVEQSFTRPADTATYASGDIICNSTTAPTIMTFNNVVRFAGGGGVLQKVLLITSVAQGLLPDIDLLLFESSITINNDNAVFSPSDADAKKIIAMIPLRAVVDASRLGVNAVFDSGAISHSFKAAAGLQAIYGVLVARNAYIPASAEEFTVRLVTSPD